MQLRGRSDRKSDTCFLTTVSPDASVTLPETNNKFALKIEYPKRELVFQPSVFRFSKLVFVSGRVNYTRYPEPLAGGVGRVVRCMEQRFFKVTSLEP